MAGVGSPASSAISPISLYRIDYPPLTMIKKSLPKRFFSALQPDRIARRGGEVLRGRDFFFRDVARTPIRLYAADGAVEHVKAQGRGWSMANNPQTSKDRDQDVLSAIEEALNLRDFDSAPSKRAAPADAAPLPPPPIASVMVTAPTPSSGSN